MALLMKSIAQFDDECRKKTTEYNDLKTQHGNVTKKDQAAVLPARDLIDLCTPDSVTQGASVAGNDFVYSEYLDTVVVILPKGADVEFLTGYETFAENVVPMSAKRFAAFDDKDGNMLWRVVCFKSSTEAFKKTCRDKRWLVRDFVYDADAYHKLTVQREQLGKQTKTHLELVKGLYQAAWSDSVVAWMHVKAARLFVESVLRFGMPPSFASFAVSPSANKVAAARKALADLFPARADAMATRQAGGRADDDDEDFFPYVSLSLTPFVVPR
jgi:V-type H+-transporting ATPase subunit C